MLLNRPSVRYGLAALVGGGLVSIFFLGRGTLWSSQRLEASENPATAGRIEAQDLSSKSTPRPAAVEHPRARDGYSRRILPASFPQTGASDAPARMAAVVESESRDRSIHRAFLDDDHHLIYRPPQGSFVRVDSDHRVGAFNVKADPRGTAHIVWYDILGRGLHYARIGPDLQVASQQLKRVSEPTVLRIEFDSIADSAQPVVVFGSLNDLEKIPVVR